VKEYPQADIPFLNDHHDAMFKVLKIVGAAIHEPSAPWGMHAAVSRFLPRVPVIVTHAGHAPIYGAAAS